MPDSSAWSAQENVTVTGRRYQPLPLAARSRTPLTVGALLSMLTVAGSVVELPAWSTAVPGTGICLPSPVTSTGAVQDFSPEPPVSPHVKVTRTVVLFQPLSFAAGDWSCPMVGAVRSIRTVALLAVSRLPARSTLHTSRSYSPWSVNVTVSPSSSGPP